MPGMADDQEDSLEFEQQGVMTEGSHMMGCSPSASREPSKRRSSSEEMRTRSRSRVMEERFRGRKRRRASRDYGPSSEDSTINLLFFSHYCILRNVI